MLSLPMDVLHPEGITLSFGLCVCFLCDLPRLCGQLHNTVIIDGVVHNLSKVEVFLNKQKSLWKLIMV